MRMKKCFDLCMKLMNRNSSLSDFSSLSVVVFFFGEVASAGEWATLVVSPVERRLILIYDQIPSYIFFTENNGIKKKIIFLDCGRVGADECVWEEMSLEKYEYARDDQNNAKHKRNVKKGKSTRSYTFTVLLELLVGYSWVVYTAIRALLTHFHVGYES